MRRLMWVLAFLTGFTAVEACGASRTSRAGSGPATTLAVDNQAFSDMTIYVVSSGQRIRLGLATGKTVSTFTIPARVIGQSRELQFLADPVGSSRTAVSEQLYVRAGERVTLMIPP